MSEAGSAPQPGRHGRLGRRARIVLVVVGALVAVAAIAGLVALVLAGMPPTGGADDRRTDGDVGARVIDDDLFGTVEVYDVDADAALSPAPAPGSITATVWQTFLRVATRDFAAEAMVEYQVGDAPESDTLAFVFRSDDPARWVLAANLATSEDPAQLVPTLIHEYAHILTLSTEQVDDEVGSCPTLELDEGCAQPASTIWRFQQEFWADYADAPDPANADWEVTDAFFAEHEEDFVSDYAATNVVEDVAESFMTFVLEDRPTGDSVVAAKLELFWSVPEYVAIRERIRAEFADELGLAR